MATKFKVGDRVRCTNKCGGGGYTFGKTYEVSRVYEDCFGNKRIGTVFDDDGDDDNGWRADNFELVSASPIRIVTRREIVSGKYGIVECDKYGRVEIMCKQHSAEELREASHLLAQLAEVLEENAAANRDGV